jgi:hypothetical protein
MQHKQENKTKNKGSSTKETGGSFKNFEHW